MAEPVAPRPQPGWPQVALVAASVVVVVLGAALLTGFLPGPIPARDLPRPRPDRRPHRRHGLAPVADLAGPRDRRRTTDRQRSMTAPALDAAVRLDPARETLGRPRPTRRHDVGRPDRRRRRRRCRARCSTRRRAGLTAALIEQDDIAVGDVVAFVAAHPWRPALPGAGAPAARPRGPRRATAPPAATRPISSALSLSSSRSTASRSCTRRSMTRA